MVNSGRKSLFRKARSSIGVGLLGLALALNPAQADEHAPIVEQDLRVQTVIVGDGYSSYEDAQSRVNNLYNEGREVNSQSVYETGPVIINQEMLEHIDGLRPSPKVQEQKQEKPTEQPAQQFAEPKIKATPNGQINFYTSGKLSEEAFLKLKSEYSALAERDTIQGRRQIISVRKELDDLNEISTGLFGRQKNSLVDIVNGNLPVGELFGQSSSLREKAISEIGETISSVMTNVYAQYSPDVMERAQKLFGMYDILVQSQNAHNPPKQPRGNLINLAKRFETEKITGFDFKEVVGSRFIGEHLDIQRALDNARVLDLAQRDLDSQNGVYVYVQGDNFLESLVVSDRPFIKTASGEIVSADKNNQIPMYEWARNNKEGKLVYVPQNEMNCIYKPLAEGALSLDFSYSVSPERVSVLNVKPYDSLSNIFGTGLSGNNNSSSSSSGKSSGSSSGGSSGGKGGKGGKGGGGSY